MLAAAIQAETAFAEQRTVITLHAVRKEDVLPVVVDEVLQRVLRRGLPETLDYYSEHFDLARFDDPEYLQALRDFLERKYAGHRFDVVIATTDTTLEFVKASGGELFPGAPVAFTASAHTLDKRGPPSSGLTATIDMSRTIAMVARLQPDTRRVFVVSGASSFDKYYENLARAQLRRFEGRFEITYWSGQPMPDLLKRVANLPPNSIVYPMTIAEDDTGQRFSVLEAFDRITTTANAPVYTWITTFMGRGAVGGSMFSPELAATRLAGLTLRILRGEKPEDIPVVEIDPNLHEVDWRQLRRWGISEARLPAGTTVRFREPGLWDRYRSYIIATVVLLLLQSALIGGLLVQRVRRQRVEQALRESERALRTSHEQNQDLAGRLITAQEAERARIARDLHDDVSQQVAGFSIVLSKLRRRLTSPPESDVDETLTTLQQRAALLADHVRSLSHELHSGVLQYGGLVAALKEHCAEFGRHHDIDVTLSADDDIGSLNPDVALCLYRVTQEALVNTARHARARAARVRLARTPDSVELDVIDDGTGFDPQRHDGKGLGLRSICERVRLAEGSVRIESQPGHGTKLLVRIPATDVADAGVAGPS